ncbi:hypothetical protein OSB04_002567 [Centaurea solstitialis]|uniref:Uncharacterized protein n=1 Tax=Centaurea solstitialis TaxID=347529 RepID=A0AA38WVD2_9ASTR|nr:hypothetical protein OSB04_002567 [Centaurea solstitialis]
MIEVTGKAIEEIAVIVLRLYQDQKHRCSTPRISNHGLTLWVYELRRSCFSTSVGVAKKNRILLGLMTDVCLKLLDRLAMSLLLVDVSPAMAVVAVPLVAEGGGGRWRKAVAEGGECGEYFKNSFLPVLLPNLRKIFSLTPSRRKTTKGLSIANESYGLKDRFSTFPNAHSTPEAYLGTASLAPERHIDTKQVLG